VHSTDRVDKSTAGDPADVRKALLELRLRKAKQSARTITAVPRPSKPPLSFAQQQLWFLHQWSGDLPIYNLPFGLRLRGPLDVPALRRALTAVVTRHESLRTRYGVEHGTPYQIIEEPRVVPLPLTDLSSQPVDEADARFAELADQHVSAVFDLATGPVMRAILVKMPADEHRLVLSLHHIAADGWSMGVLSGELAELYETETGAPGPAVALPAVQYADFAHWQRDHLTGGRLDRLIGYWRSKLTDPPTLDLPADRPRPPQPTGEGELLDHALPTDIHAAMKQLCERERVSPLAVLVSAFSLVISRYSHQDDLLIGSVLAGRTMPETEPLIGFFANTVVLRADLAGNPTAGELVRRMHETVVDAQNYQDLPFGHVVDELRPERDASRNPLFQVSFTLQNSATTGSAQLARLGAESIPLSTRTSRFDLAAQVTDEGDRYRMWVEYATTLFDSGRIRRMFGHYERALRAILHQPTARIGTIDLLTDQERTRLIDVPNRTGLARDTDGLLLHELAERHTAPPDHVALRFSSTEVTYRELDERANKLAHVLRAHGAAADKVVGILLDRGIDLPLAQLAALKAGAAWMCVDPAHPKARRDYQFADADCVAVVTTAELAAEAPGGAILLDTEPVQRALADAPAGPPAVTVHPDHCAYVIYTSGSTGRPKGVVVTHRAAVDFITTVAVKFQVTPADRVLQFANPTFDVNVFDVFVGLARGATLVLGPRDELHDPPALTKLMRTTGVTIADLPPAMLALLDPGELPDLRLLYVGLEPYPGELVNKWNVAGREFHNGYGPTEATVSCVWHECPHEPLNDSPPIGLPMPNHRAYVLDRHGQPVPVGVLGELHIAGVGLARGYLNRPDLTAGQFVPDPFGPPGQRMYRTGDVVRWRPDGLIQFAGRVDTQVKIRGFRVEPGEVEHTLRAHPDVTQAAVLVRTTQAGQNELVAFAVPSAADSSLTGGALRDHLAGYLPSHMVPASVTVLAELPVTSSGKLDHRSLLDAARTTTATGSGPVAAVLTSPTEHALAELWRMVLETDAVNAGDDFFAIGGNSLQAIQLLTRIRERFGVEVTLRSLFAGPTIQALGSLVDAQMSEVDDQAERLRLQEEIAGLTEEELDLLLADEEEL
jgi:amino acid adenylation domain-containing protein